jgi:hypothetical protein
MIFLLRVTLKFGQVGIEQTAVRHGIELFQQLRPLVLDHPRQVVLMKQQFVGHHLLPPTWAISEHMENTKRIDGAGAYPNVRGRMQPNGGFWLKRTDTPDPLNGGGWSQADANAELLERQLAALHIS